jgi:site-specific recombinase XerD
MAESEKRLKEFSEWLESEKLSETSIRSYRGQIKGFLRYCDRQRTVSGLNTARNRRNLTIRYVGYERKVKHASAHTIQSLHSALNRYWQFLGVECVRFEWERLPEHPAQILTGKERRKFLRAVKKCSSCRDRSIALLLLLLGIGNSECVTLKVADVRLDGKRSMIKVQQLGWIPVPSKVRLTLSEWMGERQLRARNNPAYKKEKWLFPTRSGSRMSTSGVNSVVTAMGESCDVQVSARTLRETYIARFLKAARKSELVASYRNNRSRYRRKMSREQRELAVQLVNEGAPIRRVAEIFGTHWGTIHQHVIWAGKARIERTSLIEEK